jgi:cobalt-zinc-cadmium efflux system membrane fusion protein
MNRRIVSLLLAACAAGGAELPAARRTGAIETEQPHHQAHQNRARNRASGEHGRDAARIVLPPDSPQLLLLKTEVVQLSEMPVDEVVAPGRVEFDPNRVSRILLPVTGRIERVMVRLGDSVTAGQTLLTVDSPDAEGAVAEWRQATANATQAGASLAKATADEERLSDLLEHRAIARKELLAADLELAQTRANLENSRATLEHARRRLEILGLDPGVAGQKVQVRAPISGKVIDLGVTPGEYRSDTSTPLLTVADLSQVWVTSDVPEKMIRFVEKGEQVEVTLVAYPAETFSARVARIADTVDVKTRTIRVQAVLPNPRGRLRPEMYGTIRHTHGLRALPTVPAGAVVRNGAEAVVFVERERGIFERLKVQLGSAWDDRVSILVGLQPGDRVVVNGAMLLSAIAGR